MAGAQPAAQGKVFLAVYDIHHRTAILQKGLQEIVVVGIPVGILHIIVDPHAVDQPQRLQALGFPLGVVFVKGVVKIVMKDGVHPDGVGPQVLDHPEPPQIGFFVNSEIGGPLPGNAHP